MSTLKDSERKRKLGRGLGALMGEIQREEPLVTSREDEDEASGSARLRMLPIASISPLPGQPRTHFDDAALSELAESISARGVIQPIIVRPHGRGYQLVAGERRWRAAQRARLHEIPAIVRDLEGCEVMALALIENLQREDLNPVEEARAYAKLADEEGMTQADIARLVDKSRSHVANIQRLLGLPDEVLERVSQGELSMGHARALIGHEDAQAIAEQAISEGLSVRQTEKLVRRKRTGSDRKGSARSPGGRSGEPDADILAVQHHLEEFLGLSVRIVSDEDPSSGAVTIRYRGLDQLDLVCQRLTGGDI